LSDRNLGQPPGQGRMVFLRPIRRPNFNISSYNPDARAPSPASYATSRGWTACARRPTHSPCHETKPGSLLAYRHDVEDCSFSLKVPVWHPGTGTKIRDHSSLGDPLLSHRVRVRRAPGRWLAQGPRPPEGSLAAVVEQRGRSLDRTTGRRGHPPGREPEKVPRLLLAHLFEVRHPVPLVHPVPFLSSPIIESSHRYGTLHRS
jgi:hypothetical protein